MQFRADFMTRILAIDVGQKRIGLAVSDEAGLGARPLYTIRRSAPEADAAKIAQAAATCQADRIIVGCPLDPEGRLGAQARKIQRFAVVLEQKLSIPVELYDERLSTAEAEQTLIEADMSRKKRRAIIDALAAARILDCYMREQAGKRPAGEGL